MQTLLRSLDPELSGEEKVKTEQAVYSGFQVGERQELFFFFLINWEIGSFKALGFQSKHWEFVLKLRETIGLSIYLKEKRRVRGMPDFIQWWGRNYPSWTYTRFKKKKRYFQLCNWMPVPSAFHWQYGSSADGFLGCEYWKQVDRGYLEDWAKPSCTASQSGVLDFVRSLRPFQGVYKVKSIFIILRFSFFYSFHNILQFLKC